MVQVSEFSISHAALAAAVMRPASAPGKLLDEIARAVAGEMIEQLDADVAAHRDEGMRRGPAGDPPQDVVAGDQPEQYRRPRPTARSAAADAVLSTSTRCFTAYWDPTLQSTAASTAAEDDQVTEKAPAYVAS